MKNARLWSWIIFALLGAGFAAVVNVITKRALSAMDVIVAMALQAAVAMIMLALFATGTGRWSTWSNTPRWAWVMMAISGVCVAMAWGCGYRALQMSDVNHATPIDRLSLPIAMILAVIFLKEKSTAINWVGAGLMLVGAFFVARTGASKQ